MNSETINERLEKLAYSLTRPFCYLCYQVAPSGRCELCLSDDLMRELSGVGVEWNVDWVIRHLLDEELTPVNSEELFESMLDDCYGEQVEICGAKFDPIWAYKQLDPVSFQISAQEYVDGIADDGELISFDNGSTYFWATDVEKLIEDKEKETEEAS